VHGSNLIPESKGSALLYNSGATLWLGGTTPLGMCFLDVREGHPTVDDAHWHKKEGVSILVVLCRIKVISRWMEL